jgi:hypothetical protein
MSFTPCSDLVLSSPQRQLQPDFDDLRNAPYVMSPASGGSVYSSVFPGISGVPVGNYSGASGLSSLPGSRAAPATISPVPSPRGSRVPIIPSSRGSPSHAKAASRDFDGGIGGVSGMGGHGGMGSDHHSDVDSIPGDAVGDLGAAGADTNYGGSAHSNSGSGGAGGGAPSELRVGHHSRELSRASVRAPSISVLRLDLFADFLFTA